MKEFLEKLLKPEIIVAIITGIVSLITLLYKTNRESRLSRITDERTKWRDEIRKLSTAISIIDVEHMEGKTKRIFYSKLSSLETRLNSYGINSKDYLKDCHIWRCIENLRNDNDCTNDEKNRLIKFLSLLLKYDWDRTKKECSLNINELLGYIIYATSNALIVFIAYNKFDNVKIKEVVLLLFVFSSVFFSPHILMFLYKVFHLKNDATNWCIPFIITILVFSVIIILSYNQFKELVLPLLLQLVALMFIAISQYEIVRSQTDYINTVKFLEKQSSSQ